jgi:hypothetical protein
MINSRQKGARGERLWRDELRAAGYLKARRGQQFSGGTDSPDVVCPELEPFHFEVKFVESLNLYAAIAQAIRDAGRRIWLVVHKRNRTGWYVTMSSETFFALLRGDYVPTNVEIQTLNQDPAPTFRSVECPVEIQNPQTH